MLTVIFASQAIGGFIGGMAGSIEILGMYRRFQYTASPQYGFDGIIIATLADYKPVSYTHLDVYKRQTCCVL